MSAAIMETQLVRLLNSDPTLSRRGCVAARRRIGGVTIDQNGHHRGIWNWHGTGFEYTPGGYSEPTIEVMTPTDALVRTQQMTTAKG